MNTPSTKVKVTLVILLAIFMLIGLYSVEIFFSLKFAPRPHRPPRATDGKEVSYDVRTRLQALSDLRAKKLDAYLAVHPNLFVELGQTEGPIFPLSGISGKTTLLCYENGEHVVYESDEHGFNNPRGLWGGNGVEAVLIGDSFTHGMCVKPGEDIAGQMRKMGVKTLSLGMGGSGPLLELAILEEYAKPVAPEIVFWIYYEANDFTDLDKEREVPILLRYLDGDFSQGLIKRQFESDRMIKEYHDRTIATPGLDIQPNGQIEKIAKLFTTRILFSDYFLTFRDSNLTLFREVLLQAKERTATWGGRLYFVYLPNFKRFAMNVVHNDKFKSKGKVLSIVRDTGIPILDITDVFSAHQDLPSLFATRTGGHYNAEGYRLVAQTIFDTVYPTNIRRP